MSRSRSRSMSAIAIAETPLSVASDSFESTSKKVRLPRLMKIRIPRSAVAKTRSRSPSPSRSPAMAAFTDRTSLSPVSDSMMFSRSWFAVLSRPSMAMIRTPSVPYATKVNMVVWRAGGNGMSPSRPGEAWMRFLSLASTINRSAASNPLHGMPRLI